MFLALYFLPRLLHDFANASSTNSNHRNRFRIDHDHLSIWRKASLWRDYNNERW